MPKYLYTYHGGSMPETPEEGEAMMAAWMSWFGQLGEAVVDGGNPTSMAKTVSADSVVDGGGANPATGYSLVNASDLDAAVEMAKGCPVLSSGGTVEVAELMEM